MSDKAQKKAALLAEVEKQLGSAYGQLDEATKDKLADVFTDEAFVKKLFTLEEPEDVQAAFKEKGLSYTIEEIKEMHVAMLNKFNSEGELSDEQMAQAAGGSITVGLIVGAFVVGVVTGVVDEAVSDGYKAVKKKTGFKW